MGASRHRVLAAGPCELASVGELSRSYHDCVAGFALGTGFEESPQECAMWEFAHAV